jgi:hypothetical protein
MLRNRTGESPLPALDDLLEAANSGSDDSPSDPSEQEYLSDVLGDLKSRVLVGAMPRDKGWAVATQETCS